MSRLHGYSKRDRRRDRRRPVPLGASLDGMPVAILDLSLSGVGAGMLSPASTGRLRLHEGQRARLEFNDARGREVSVLVQITYFSAAEGRFGGRFEDLSDADFDVIQDLMLRRHRAAAE